MSKKIKIEETESANSSRPFVLFKKTVTETSDIKPVGQLKKNNFSLFIKKKPLEIKGEPVEESPQESKKPNLDSAAPGPSLLSLMSNYADSDEDSD